jgi:hypothetical protein
MRTSLRSGLFGAAAGLVLAIAAAPSASAEGVASAPDPRFVEEAVGAYLGTGDAAGLVDLDALAAAPELDFRTHPRELGRLWVQEIVLGAGDARMTRQASEEAAGGGETPRRALSRLVTDASRVDSRALLRATARLYTTVWSEASPSRLRLFDLEGGALDAAPPEAMTVRHRSFVTDGETDALRLTWPSDGGDGAAVVRYVDAGLPADVVFFSAGDRRAIPLSGVARIDFLVAGRDLHTPGLKAPVECARETGAPFWRLEARAETSSTGPRLTWSTTSHSGLRGWAIFREEIGADGRIVRWGPEVVPSSEDSTESFAYAFVDTSATAETFYRYTVWAVTDEGLLTRAFSVSLETGRLEISRLRRD